MRHNKVEIPNLAQTELFKEQAQAKEKIIEDKEKKQWFWFRLFKAGKPTVYFCYAPNDRVACRAFNMDGYMEEDTTYGTPKIGDEFFKTIPPNYLGKEKVIMVPVAKGKKQLPIKIVSYQRMEKLGDG
ncbi:MAG: hypothetical protein PHT40_03400 [Patescibacteria group bacterium]|nr:hypothetical protein [Patescibacteria group bacterium]